MGSAASRSTAPRSADALRREVEEAFADRDHPGDERLVDRSPGCRGSEGEAARRHFDGRTWREVAGQRDTGALEEHLPFLSVDGFAYYLPAFLLHALDFDGMDHAVIFRLWSFPEEVSARLGPEEKRATVHVLEHLAAEHARRCYVRNDAQQALDEYWAYFTDQELGFVDAAP